MNLKNILLQVLDENKILKEKLNKYEEVHEFKRGDVVIIKEETKKIENGSVQTNARPYIVVSNNIGNHFSKIVLAVPLTTKEKKVLPTHFKTSYHNSIALCEQIMTFSQKNIKFCNYNIPSKEMKEMNKCLKISLGILED